MRLLTDEDMRWVAGGDPNSQGYEGQMYTDSSGTWIFEGGSWHLYDIEVVGHTPPPPPPPPYFPGGGGGGGGGVTPSPPPPPSPPPTPCEERAIDNRAWGFYEEVNDTFDPFAGSNQEYIAVMYRNAANEIVSTAISTQGNDTNASIRLTGISYSQLVGIIHTHPFDSSQAVNELNKQPSPFDWSMFDSLVTGGASASELRTYIVGPDGQIRQYDSTSTRGAVSNDIVYGQQSC